MRLGSIAAIIALALAAQACVAQSDGEVIADGPTPPRYFVCADGREVSYVAMMGGFVSVLIDGQATEMQQVDAPGLSGYVHEGGGLGWRILPDGNAEIADLSRGQPMVRALRIPCALVAR